METSIFKPFTPFSINTLLLFFYAEVAEGFYLRLLWFCPQLIKYQSLTVFIP